MIDISDVNVYPYDLTLTGSESLRRTSTSFGDGYEETRLKGINPLISQWEASYTFTTLVEARSFMTLLRQNQDITIWKSPIDTVAQRYMCFGWSITAEDSSEVYRVSVTFKRWYGN